MLFSGTSILMQLKANAKNLFMAAVKATKTTSATLKIVKKLARFMKTSSNNLLLAKLLTAETIELAFVLKCFLL